MGRVKLKAPRMAICHPDRISAGNGLCKACYTHDYYIKNKVRIQAKAKINYIKYKEKGYYEANKERILENQKLYREKNREQIRERWHAGWAKHKYGISQNDYDEILNRQKGLCAICKKIPKQRKNRQCMLCIDHDHITGKVRGLLCDPCNIAIAYLDENPEIFKAALDYLDRHLEE